MTNIIGEVAAEAATEVARLTPTLEIPDLSDPFAILDTDIGKEDEDELQINKLVLHINED